MVGGFAGGSLVWRRRCSLLRRGFDVILLSGVIVQLSPRDRGEGGGLRAGRDA